MSSECMTTSEDDDTLCWLFVVLVRNDFWPLYLSRPRILITTRKDTPQCHDYLYCQILAKIRTLCTFCNICSICTSKSSGALWQLDQTVDHTPVIQPIYACVTGMFDFKMCCVHDCWDQSHGTHFWILCIGIVVHTCKGPMKIIESLCETSVNSINRTFCSNYYFIMQSLWIKHSTRRELI